MLERRRGRPAVGGGLVGGVGHLDRGLVDVTASAEHIERYAEVRCRYDEAVTALNATYPKA